MNDDAQPPPTPLPPPPPTPSSGPSPGWYPDPATGVGLRWWDGESWTDQTAPAPPGPGDPAANGLVASGEWLRQSIRLAVERAGHFFPMVVLLMVPATLANGLSLWFALRRAVLVTNSETGTFSFTNPGVGPLAWVAVGATSVLVVVAGLFLAVAVARQAEAHLDERSEPWSTSMRDALTRLPRVVLVGLVIVGVGAGLYGVMMVSGLVAPGFVLVTAPLWLVGTLVVVIRFGLAPTAAALAPAGVGPLSVSWDLTRNRFWALFGRMGLLVLVGLGLTLMASFVSAPFTAIAGGVGSSGVAPAPDEFRFGDLLGENPAVFAIGQLFSALANGAATIIWAAGMTLIYRMLSGPSTAVVGVGEAAAGEGAGGPAAGSGEAGIPAADDGV